MKYLLPALLAISCPFGANAARPLVTDDARLTAEGSCQLESWTRIYPDRAEFWALPACNPGGNLEIAVGVAWAGYEGEPSTYDYVAQAKTLFQPVETNGWGWGLALGINHHSDANPGPNQLGNTYAYVPVSISLLDDRALLHINVGWLRDKATATDNLSWGIGVETQVSPRILWIAETFGDNHGENFGQIGMRYAPVPERFQVDITLGRQLSGQGDDHWLSFGLRYTPDKLF